MRNSLYVLVIVSALLAGCSGMPYAPVNYSNGLMAGANGRTLYTFDKDTAGSGKSVCNAACATNWPSFTASAADQAGGDWTIVKRDDGTQQWAWSGKPLYYWSKDQKAGDVTGDGFNNNAWHAVRPEPRPMTGSMSGP